MFGCENRDKGFRAETRRRRENLRDPIWLSRKTEALAGFGRTELLLGVYCVLQVAAMPAHLFLLPGSGAPEACLATTVRALPRARRSIEYSGLFRAKADQEVLACV